MSSGRDRSVKTLQAEKAYNLSMQHDLSLRIPKNKSTGNLLVPKSASSADIGRIRFSFDAGTDQDGGSSRRTGRVDYESGLGTSGLRRIRRIGVTPKTPGSTLHFEDNHFVAPPLMHSKTMPHSTSSSRSVSVGYFTGGPASPTSEDVQRFPSESLHSFSFARQSEDLLHNRQNILKKSVEFMRDRSTWASNPGLADAQARASGDSELQGMMTLLKRANLVPSEYSDSDAGVTSSGPLTGPPQASGHNIFEKSFDQRISDPVDRSGNTPSPAGMNVIHQTETDENDMEAGGLEIMLIPSQSSPTAPRRLSLKRTYTDVTSASLRQKLMDAMAKPYAGEGTILKGMSPRTPGPGPIASGSAVHTHSSKWSPAAQAVFRTEADAPWTILAANDLACLNFGVTRAEVRSLSILGIIQEDRRPWLESKLGRPPPPPPPPIEPPTDSAQANGAKSLLTSRGGITALLLSKAPSRAKNNVAPAPPPPPPPPPRPEADYFNQNDKHHPHTKSRGVILCGDVLPIQKRDGTKGAASFWVMEKKGGFIWVIEEINENVAFVKYDDSMRIVESSGECEAIWGMPLHNGIALKKLIPQLLDIDDSIKANARSSPDLIGHYTVVTNTGNNVPVAVERSSTPNEFRISCLPHIAGVMVLNPTTLCITSSNSVFSAALFGYEQPDGLSMSTLIPGFSEILEMLMDEDGIEPEDGLVIPEHSFRRARALLALRDKGENPSDIFLNPSGLRARHRDGSDIMVDLQMRVVHSESVFPVSEEAVLDDIDLTPDRTISVSELVYAVWITYSRQLHSAGPRVIEPDPADLPARPYTPPIQPDPPAVLSSPPQPSSNTSVHSADSSQLSLAQTITDSSVAGDEPLEHPPPHIPYVQHVKKTIADFTILEEMGSGAYGQVKLARYRKGKTRKMVIKYVTKKRILVDTWTRDRRLGTVPLEVHVMDYLRRDGMKHPNIVEMVDFFEDDVNYYIEMLPHGIPGMDLFDYIELRADMQETECRSIFTQVVSAIYHLHTKAFVVHRDIKDENVVLDGEGKIKIIDFGSAAYIKSGPFDVFVGTIDYAAPEVLQGKPYAGTEQDIWALGILLYTIVYKENPFYNVDEILDHPLRVPFIPFSELCIDLIRGMLDRDVQKRLTIEEVQDHLWLQTE